MKTTIAATWLAAAMLAAAPERSTATPQSTPVHRIAAGSLELSAGNLESAFWVCDYVASTHGMQYVSMDLCGAITDLIKTEKFGGDYDEMVRWWQEHKGVEHLRLRLEEIR